MHHLSLMHTNYSLCMYEKNLFTLLCLSSTDVIISVHFSLICLMSHSKVFIGMQ